MNDKVPTAEEKPPFDPAAAGWDKVSTIGFGELTGPLWRREDAGRLRFGVVTAQKHLNRAGNVHGGLLMTLADQAMAMTARHAHGAKRHATIELNIQFVDSVRIGDFVEAQCEVVRVTRSVAFMQGRISVAGRVVAMTTGIWKILGT